MRERMTQEAFDDLVGNIERLIEIDTAGGGAVTGIVYGHYTRRLFTVWYFADVGAREIDVIGTETTLVRSAS